MSLRDERLKHAKKEEARGTNETTTIWKAGVWSQAGALLLSP